MVIACQNCYDDNNKGADIPDEETSRDSIQKVGQEDIEEERHGCDEVGHKHCMPSFNDIVWVVQVCDAKYEVCSDKIVHCTHCNDACVCELRSPYPNTLSSLPVNINHPQT